MAVGGGGSGILHEAPKVLDTQAGGKEALDHEVVQVTGDAFAVRQQQGLLAKGTDPSEVQSEADPAAKQGA